MPTYTVFELGRMRRLDLLSLYASYKPEISLEERAMLSNDKLAALILQKQEES
jgi:hypothetical protein